MAGALLLGWAVCFGLFALYGQLDVTQTVTVPTVLAAISAGLLWPRIAPAPGLPGQAVFVVLLVAPLLVTGFVIFWLISGILSGLGDLLREVMDLPEGGWRIGLDLPGLALDLLLIWFGLRAGIALSLWRRRGISAT